MLSFVLCLATAILAVDDDMIISFVQIGKLVLAKGVLTSCVQGGTFQFSDKWRRAEELNPKPLFGSFIGFRNRAGTVPGYPP